MFLLTIWLSVNWGITSNDKLVRGKIIYSLQNTVNLLKMIIVIIKGIPDIKRAAFVLDSKLRGLDPPGLLSQVRRPWEAVAQRCSVKKVFLLISQNSQENTCARVSFLIKLQTRGLQLYQKKRIWHSCFPVNFAKFLKTPFLREHLRWLLL